MKKREYLDWIRVFAVLYGYLVNAASFVMEELTVFSGGGFIYLSMMVQHIRHGC